MLEDTTVSRLMRPNLAFDEKSETGQYFLRCARIRGITVSSLLKRLFDVIGEDQLVANVLDDSDQIKSRRRYEHRYSSRSQAAK